MTSGAEEKLARVTYLPGVQPPSAPLDQIPGLVRASEINRPGAQYLQGTKSAEVNVVIHPADADPVPEPEPRSTRAHSVSLNALARRGVSIAEMADLLTRRELDEASIHTEIDRLERVGLLDDTELARTLVRTLRERKGLGRSAVMAELRRRKIDPGAIDTAVEEAYDVDATDEVTRAREIAVKRAGQLRSLDPETARRRLSAFLMRKGYSGSIVASAVAAALSPNHPSFHHANGDGPRFR